jgi:gliding motility-associated-like protein
MKHLIRQVSILICIACLYSSHTFGQVPDANFSANVTEECGIVSVKFTNLSTNSPTTLDWDFGEGRSSTLTNPTIVFTSPGEYTISLTATNASGSDTETKEAYIKVYANPEVGFLASPREGCTPLYVNFTDISTSALPITSISWDFGDGSTSAGENTNYTYITASDYSVSLTVTNAEGCSQTLSKSDYISVQNAPTSNFTMDAFESCSAPFTVSFTNTSTGASSYLWDFGDGNTSTDANPTHTFTSEGDFSVSLTVTNDVGCTDTKDSIQAIHINTFSADFSSPNQTVCLGTATNFVNESNLPVSSVEWDFGDGNTSAVENTSHTYAAVGTYTVTLSATSSAGCTSTQTLTNYITINDLPDIFIQANDSISCLIPFSVNFTGPTTNITDWDWNFGDGNTATNSTPTHDYAALGNYTVSLSITDNNSCENSLTKTDYIRVHEPQADFTSNVTNGCLPLEVEFTDASTSESPIAQWDWDFGDGNTVTVEDNGSGGYIWTENGTIVSNDSSAIHPTHIFAADTGQYTITLTITDEQNCTDTYIAEDYIGVGAPPTAHLSAVDTAVCFNAITEFEDTTSNSFANEWIWDYGDETAPAYVNTPTHEYVYGDTGTYTVKLVAGQYQCYADTITKEDYITILPPVAQYTVSPGFLCESPDTIEFNRDETVLADTYTWTFGDGTTLFIEESGLGGYTWRENGVEIVNDTTAINPRHAYQTPGTFSTQLKVANANGCEDSMSIEIQVDSLLLGFEQTNIETCQHSAIEFTDTTLSNFNITNWEWDFGDGNTSIEEIPTHQFDASGDFNIKLKITNEIGCVDSITRASYITVNEVPKPDFDTTITSKTIGCVPFTVEFADNSTATAPDSVISWLWNFNDGTTLLIEDTTSAGYNWTINGTRFATDTSKNNPTHIFTSRGEYDISLTATDSKGCDTTITKINYITASIPHPGITVAPVTCHYSEVEFTNSSTGTGLTYNWSFGDGSPNSSVTSPSHSYFVTKDSTIEVSLEATDVYGCDSTITESITIARPYALFEADSTEADCPPFIPQFTDTSGLSISFWVWNFGDSISMANNTSSLQNPQHSYNKPGIYDVQLIVEDANSCVDTTIKENYIEVGGPTGTFTFSPTDSCAPAPILFEANTQDAIEHLWVFDDGEAISDDETITYTYTQGRTYTPALVITDINECEQVIVADEQLTIYEAQVDFTAPTLVCQEQTIPFENITNSSHDITTWLWEFGDDSTSIEDTVAHFYNYGTYTVRVTASIEECDFIEERINYLSVLRTPNTSFEVKNPAYQYEELAFTNTSDSLPVPVITNWFFGDNNTDTTYSPTHTYTRDGNFTIRLEQYTVSECRDTTLFTITIQRDVLLPNVFTPDKDGVNDIYMEGMDLQLQIINRWGQELYRGKDGWDGTHNGKKVSAGTYFYIVALPDGTLKKGPVTLLRNE